MEMNGEKVKKNIMSAPLKITVLRPGAPKTTLITSILNTKKHLIPNTFMIKSSFDKKYEKKMHLVI